MEINLENVTKELNKQLALFKERYSSSIDQGFNIKPKIVMNLFLTFESYDQTTANKDVYMQEEKVIQFNVGYMKLSFKGKLRLTQNKKENENIMYNFQDAPDKTYGVVEERGIIFL